MNAYLHTVNPFSKVLAGVPKAYTREAKNPITPSPHRRNGKRSASRPPAANQPRGLASGHMGRKPSSQQLSAAIHPTHRVLQILPMAAKSNQQKIKPLKTLSSSSQPVVPSYASKWRMPASGRTVEEGPVETCWAVARTNRG